MAHPSRQAQVNSALLYRRGNGSPEGSGAGPWHTVDWWQAGSFLTTAWKLKINILQFQGSFETPSTYGPGPLCR